MTATGTAVDARAAGLTEQGVARLTRILQREIADRRLPGAVAMISRGGRIGYLQAHGRQAPGSDAVMRTDSLFRIFSMTKPITSVAIMMLVEEGRLLLGDPISKYIPEFAELKAGVEKDGKLSLQPLVRPVTVQDLLRHTSGFSYDFVGTGPLAKLYVDAKLHDRSVDNAEFCRRLAALPLLHQPGTHWAYSHSTDVLGRIVEVLHAKPLADVLAETIFGPLGMQDTAFSAPPEKVDRLAQPFATDPDTGNAVQLYDPRGTPKLHSGGGGLVGTALDYARFCQMLAGGGELGHARILGRKTVEFMASDHLGRDVVIDQALGLLPPGHGFGLGFAVRRVTGEASFPGSAGTFYWGGIAGTTFWLDPKEDLWALLMIQAPGQREYYRMLFRNLVYSALA